jgi:hypothetical protein
MTNHKTLTKIASELEAIVNGLSHVGGGKSPTKEGAEALFKAYKEKHPGTKKTPKDFLIPSRGNSPAKTVSIEGVSVSTDTLKDMVAAKKKAISKAQDSARSNMVSSVFDFLNSKSIMGSSSGSGYREKWESFDGGKLKDVEPSSRDAKDQLRKMSPKEIFDLQKHMGGFPKVREIVNTYGPILNGDMDEDSLESILRDDPDYTKIAESNRNLFLLNPEKYL